MSIFEELTMGELARMRRDALRTWDTASGTWVPCGIDVADPMEVATAIMWTMARRDDPTLDFEAYSDTVKSPDVAAFHAEHGEQIEDDPENPPVAASTPTWSTPHGSGAIGGSHPVSTVN